VCRKSKKNKYSLTESEEAGRGTTAYLSTTKVRLMKRTYGRYRHIVAIDVLVVYAWDENH
jgi:hypothetical protein